MEIDNKDIIFIILVVLVIGSLIYYNINIKSILKIVKTKDNEYDKKMEDMFYEHSEKTDYIIDNLTTKLDDEVYSYIENKMKKIEKNSMKILEKIEKDGYINFVRFEKSEKKLYSLKKEDIEIYEMLINLLINEDIEKNKFLINKIKKKKEKFEKDLKR